MKELSRIDPDEVKRYYVDQHHSLLQTAEYFGRSQSGMEKFLRRNGIKKPLDEVAKIRGEIVLKNYANSDKKSPVNKLDWKMPDSDELKEKYLSGMTQKQLASLYGVSIDTMRSWLKKYDIKKSSDGVKETRIATTRKHFGCDYAMQSEVVKEKSREKCIEKYGVDHYSKTQIGKIPFLKKIEIGLYPSQEELQKEFIEENKSRNEICQKYGFSSAVFKRLTKFYGIKKPYDKIFQNMNKTSEALYGTDSNHVPGTVEKRRKTCKEKYGAENVMYLDEFKDKLKCSFENKYGVDSSWKIPGIKDKRDETMRAKYGDVSYFRARVPSDTVALLQCKKKYEEYLDSHEKRTEEQIAADLGCSQSLIQKVTARYGLIDKVVTNPISSSKEKEIGKLLDGLGIEYLTNDRSILDGKEIDIYIPTKKIGIEFNGDYWHSSLFQEKTYHFDKSKLAESKGIRLIHIYEYEWNTMKDKIIQLLKIALGIAENKIYARKCEIREITNQEAKILNDKVHLQGHRNAQVTYGLYYHGELVQLMSFSRTHYNRNLKGDNSWEIIRGCPGSNNIVVGGVSKLFSRFIRDYDPDEVFSYCDFNKFDGKSYEAIGMKFVGYTGPDKTYLIDGVAYKRNPSKYKEYKEKAEAVIWGAGSKKYLWKKEESL